MARITDTDSDDLVLACGQAKDGGGKTIGVSAYDGECFGTHLFFPTFRDARLFFFFLFYFTSSRFDKDLL